MKKKPFLTYLLMTLLLISNFGFSQVKASTLLQDSKFHSDTSSVKLFMVEFWATWCGPCIAVSDYLEVLLEEFASEVYILSLSEETSDRVKKFSEKNPSQFASAIDYDGQTFDYYGVTDLPYAVLLNDKAKVVWKGNPADLTPSMIRQFVKQNDTTFEPKQFIDLESYVFEDTTIEDLKTPFEFSSSELLKSSGLTIISNQKYKQIEGSLKQILGYLMKVSPVQIQISEEYNKVYLLKFKPSYDLLSIAEEMVNNLDLKFQKLYKESDVLWMKFTDTNKFWSSSQFDWGTDSPQFLVDDYQFSADNSTVADVMYKLSELLGVTVLFDKNMMGLTSKFDWQLHYKFFDLMSDDLYQNFGIEVEKVKRLRPLFNVIK